MKRMLFISHCVPYPPDKGDRVRAFNEIRILSEHFRITVAALSRGPCEPGAVEALGQWARNVFVARVDGPGGMVRGAASLLAGRSVTEGFFASAGLREFVAKECRKDPFDLVMGYSSSTLPYVLSAPAGARIMDLVDVDSAKWAAYAQNANWPSSWLYRKESRTVKELEVMALARCDAVLLVSEAEVRLLPGQGRKAVAIGNGVDTEYFAPRKREGKHPCLVFTGTMDYRPNIEGVCWFAREVWPELRRRLPNLGFDIVGRNPAPPVCRLAPMPGIRVTGSVPDVRPYLADADVVVCPLRVARGIQNKILEAMAMARAVVASPGGIDGLDVQVGQEVLRAESPQQWVEAIEGLLGDPARRDAVGRAARSRVEAGYTWPARLAPLVSLCNELAGLPSERSPERPHVPRVFDNPRKVAAI